MRHKQSVFYGKAMCGARRVSMSRFWKNVDCVDCLKKRKELGDTRQYKDVRDELYIGSLEEKLDAELEEIMRYESGVRDE